MWDMSYFLSAVALTEGAEITIVGEEALHITQSRRMEVGDQFHLQGPDGKRFQVAITALERQSVRVNVRQSVVVPTESHLQLTICQALIDEKALDLVIQKATELGVTRLIIFNSDRTPTRFGARAEDKLTRWKKIVLEAAKQCDRVQPTEIIWCDTLEKAQTVRKREALLPDAFGSKASGSSFRTVCAPHRIFLSQHAKQSFVAYLSAGHPGVGRPARMNEVIRSGGEPDPGTSLDPCPTVPVNGRRAVLQRDDTRGKTNILLFVGPEGGWSEGEEKLLLKAGVTPVVMGPRVLRAETAALVAATLAQAAIGDMV